LDYYYPPGQPSGLTNDNPFPLVDLAMVNDGVAGRVALAHQGSMDQLDALLVNAKGAVNVMWVVGGGNWQGPVALTKAGFAHSGASIALAHQLSIDQLDALLVDANGAVNVMWVVGEGKWQGPVALTGLMNAWT
jgi:hypothetical protein